jgi:ATP-dependent DNA helicase MPH1
MTQLSWIVTICPKLTGSIGACYESLKEASRNKEDDGGDGKKDKKSKSLRDDPHFKTLMLELETQRSRGFGTHPKVEKLKQLLIQHFGSKLGDETEDGSVDDSRVMVFSSYRAVVDEIVEELSRERPLIRAYRFIGQGVDKQGNKGLAQKEQLEVSSRSVNAMTIITLSTGHQKVQSG